MKKYETKVTVDEKEVNLYVVKPDNGVIKDADRYKAKTWNQCIMDNVLTKQELGKIMRERGIWTEEDRKREEDITTEISDIEKQLYLGVGGKRGTIEDGKKLALKIKTLRNELTTLISERLGMEENTAEALADNARFDYFVASCSYYENGERIYSGVDDYNAKGSDAVASAAANKLAQVMYQIDNNYEASLPENKWLSKFGIINEDQRFVNDKNELVDSENRRINELNQYIDKDGNRVDKDGNALDEDGNYVLQVDYTDAKAVKKKKKAVVVD